ncbi:MAG: PAS domain S-box protein [Bryobacteraceae bacterium]
MRKFRDIPIKQKLMVAIMVASLSGLLLAGAGIVVADSILFRRYLKSDLSALSKIAADNSTGALAFDDPEVAAETLAALRARAHVMSACIYRLDGTVLASYLRPGETSGCPRAAPQYEIRSVGSSLEVSRPVMLQGRQVGAFVLRYDLEEIGERAVLYGTTVFSVLLLSSLIALLLSSRLRAIIAAPTLQLVEATTSVSRTKDYSIRAQKLSADEMGVLTDAFNEMLTGIQTRDNDLRKALLDRGEALQEAENARKFLETTLASIGDAVISTDTAGRIIFANPVAQSLLGWTQAELTGRRLDEPFRIVNELTRAAVESPVAKVLREGSIVGLANHTILISRDGAEIPIDDSGAPIRDAAGTIHGTVLVFRDVTARRKAEQTMQLLASIVESSADAIIGHDLKGLFTSWNKGAERIFGYSTEETIGRPTSLISSPNRGDEMPDVLERIKRGEKIEQYQAVRRTKSGEEIDVAITISPLYDELGRIIGASKIARDITGQVRAAERLARLNSALQQSNESLARSNQDLERFAFVASHDLQEPLRMITVYSQLLIQAYPGTPDRNAGTFIEYIVGGTKRMRELLADLLAYSEIRARPEEPRAPVDLSEVMEKVKQNLRASISETGAVIAHDPFPVVSAHEGHFISLFQNLIGNALKYRGSQPPRIHISMQNSTGPLQFSVADNGQGIAPEHQEKIFTPFKRLHGRDIPGTGIGLAICQRIVERYGGRIWVESEAGSGATFRFTLPALSQSSEEI